MTTATDMELPFNRICCSDHINALCNYTLPL